VKQFLIDPFGGPTFLQNRIFDGPYDILRQLLLERGISLNTYDEGDLGAADKVLCFNYDGRFVDSCYRAGISKDQLSLFMFEPSVVIPEQYDPAVWDRFGMVFTWRDDLVDGDGFRKLRFPQGQVRRKDLPTYESRYFLTLINANKYSYRDREIYSLRRKAIRFFEGRDVGFDLYGVGWDEGSKQIDIGKMKYALKNRKFVPLVRDLVDGLRGYPSYRGSIRDKYEVLARYRFSICFENEAGAPGFITEKIFDCLHCETVPIYLGAPNIEDYVPSECFIDFGRFSGFPDLLEFLRGLDEGDYHAYVEAGRRYLDSGAFERWRPASVFSSIVDALVGD
jgi:alpha(1,3/1,4) fucosyltransferase